MNRKALSGIMLTLLLIGMLMLAFEIQTVKSEPEIWTVNDDEPAAFRKIQEALKKFVSIPEWSRHVTDSFSLHPADDEWTLEEATEWYDFFADNDSVELVIGINESQLDSYAQLMTLTAEYGGQLVKTVSIENRVKAALIDMPFGQLSSFAADIESSALSRYIEPNFKFHTSIVPNDYYWSRQWGPVKIEADQAWNWQTGDPSVLVAVIDTGVDYNHPDLAANYVPLGYDWRNNDTDPMDDTFHGTHCAGILAGELNNGIGIAGLAQVRIMAEKGLGPEGGRAVDLANAIVHAVDQGASILSNSWGGPGQSELIHEAVKYAYDHGVLVVAAAGNEASDVKIYPAAYDEVVAVTATDEFDNPALFTNYGDWVEVAAPGVLIYSTISQEHDPRVNYPYGYASGTSMSTPHVAGVAALIWSQFPNMTRDEVRLRLQSTTDDLGEPGFDIYYGYGRINARKAVEKALPSHDLLIWSFEAPLVLEPGKMVLINTTVLNFGENDEENVLVQLLVN